MKLDQCPACNSNNIIYFLTTEDYLVSHEKFSIYDCQNCHLRFTYPRPDHDQLARYYDSEEYISHTDANSSLINRVYKIARRFTLRGKRKLLEKICAQHQLLDVGCGTGHFISYCKRYGWNVNGVEPNELARNLAEENTNISIHKDLAEVGNMTFDAITLWHVLEHLPQLDQTIAQLKSLLSVDGSIIIAVPNYEAYEATIFNEYWAAYDVPRHLYHFNRDSMTHLLTKHGLKIVKAYPMWLDSFYISLLSYKNKYGMNRYLKSIVTGLLSNVYAIKSTNYSSLIYQITRSDG